MFAPSVSLDKLMYSVYCCRIGFLCFFGGKSSFGARYACSSGIALSGICVVLTIIYVTVVLS